MGLHEKFNLLLASQLEALKEERDGGSPGGWGQGQVPLEGAENPSQGPGNAPWMAFPKSRGKGTLSTGEAVTSPKGL